MDKINTVMVIIEQTKFTAKCLRGKKSYFFKINEENYVQKKVSGY